MRVNNGKLNCPVRHIVGLKLGLSFWGRVRCRGVSSSFWGLCPSALRFANVLSKVFGYDSKRCPRDESYVRGPTQDEEVPL